MAISKFCSDDFEKRGMGRGLVALQSFWSLKKGTRSFNIRSNDSSPDILGPLGRYDHPEKKEKKDEINTHP